MSAQAISAATLDRIIGGIEKSHVCRMEHEGEWCSQCEKVNAARAELRQIRDALDDAAAANAEMRKALEFYADEERYKYPNMPRLPGDPYTPADEPYMRDITRDRGALARAALAPKETK